jgi:hypothetical protein
MSGGKGVTGETSSRAVMNVQRDIDDEQAAVIDQRIGQGFAFLRDVLAAPSIVDEIPSGSTLAYHDVAIGQGEVRLTAFHAPDSDRWGVRVTGQTGLQRDALAFLWALQPVLRDVTWETAVVAFASLEAALQRVTQEQSSAAGA